MALALDALVVNCAPQDERDEKTGNVESGDGYKLRARPASFVVRTIE